MFVIIHLVSFFLCIYGKKSKGGSTIVITSNGCGCSSKGNDGKLVVTGGDKKNLDNIIINNKADECCEKSWSLPEAVSVYPMHQFMQMPLPKFPIMPSFYPYNPLLINPLNNQGLLFSDFHNLKSWDHTKGENKKIEKTTSPRNKIDEEDTSKKMPTFIPAAYFNPFVNFFNHPSVIHNVLPSNYRNLHDSYQLHPLFIQDLTGIHSFNNAEMLNHHIAQIDNNKFLPLYKSYDMFNMNPNIYHLAEVDELNDNKVPQVEYVFGLKKYDYNQQYDRYNNDKVRSHDEIEFPSVNYDSINDKRRRERMSEQRLFHHQSPSGDYIYDAVR